MISHPLFVRMSSWFSQVSTEEGTAIDWHAVSNKHTQWNMSNSPYFKLPQEIQMLVTLNLPAEDLLNTALVCRNWRGTVQQEHLWRHLYRRDSASWQLLGNVNSKESIAQQAKRSAWPSVRSLLATSGDEETASESGKWRDAYLRQYRLNRSRFAPSQVAAKLSFSAESSLGGQWELRLPFARKVHRILMFGEGLETSARKLLYTLLWSKNSPFQMTRAYPGVEGVGSGFGFRVGNKELALAALYKYDTPGVFDRVRPQWRELFLSTSGFVFVVDPSQDLARARADLATFMDAEWIPHHAPLLVLVIHHTKPLAVDASDSASPPSSPANSPPRSSSPLSSSSASSVPPSMVEIAEALQLTSRRSKQFLVRYCAWPDGLHGVVDGISWLSENL